LENRKETMQKGMEKASHSIERATETIGDTIIAVLDKLAGKKSDLKLSFEDLTLETGMLKTKINGSIVLDIVYAQDTEPKPKE
jgi:endonuclease IV